MYTDNNHSDVGLIANAVAELEDGLMKLTDTSYASIDKLMQSISKRNRRLEYGSVNFF